MEYFNAVLNQVIIFMIIIVLGFVIIKTKFIPTSVLQPLSVIFTRVIVPAIVFINTVNGATREDMINTIFLLGVMVCIFAILITMMRLVSKALRLKGNRGILFPVAFSFGNVGFIGIPLLLAIFGQRVMLFVTMYAIVDQLVLWTYGYSQTFPEDNRLKFTPKTLLNMVNPPIIAILLSVVMIFLDLSLPNIAERAISSIANAGMALPFIYIGGMLATMTDFRKLARIEFSIGIFLKMLVLPVVIFIAMRTLGLDRDMAIATSILFGLPAMPVIPMLASINGSDVEYATSIVMVTTVACLFTLTLVTYLMAVVL